MTVLERPQIGDCVEPVAAWNPLRAPADEAFTYIDLSAVDQQLKKIVDIKRLQCGEAPSRARQLVQSGDVLVSTVRPNLNGVASVPFDADGATASTGFCVLRPQRKRLDSRYLFHWVQSTAFIDDMVQKATGASYPAISDRIVKESKIPLPPLPEQRRIAAILDQADALRAKRREALDQLNKLAQAVFADMFGDPIRNPRGWRVAPLADCAERIQIGPFGSQLHEEDYVEGGVPLVNPTHIQHGKICPDLALTVPKEKFDQLAQYHLATGDVILGRRGEMGRCAVVGEHEHGWLCGTGSLFVRLKSTVLTSNYLSFVISSSSMRRYLENAAQGVTMTNLNKTIVGSMPIPLPPMTDQRRFSERLGCLESLGSRASQSARGLDDLFSAVQQRAFRGEL